MVQSLRIGDEMVGRVYVTYPEAQEFADEESALLGDVVRRVSGYIENRRLLEETEQASRRLGDERAVLRTLIDSLPDPTFIKDQNSRYVVSNVAHSRSWALGRRKRSSAKPTLTGSRRSWPPDSMLTSRRSCAPASL